MPDILSQDETTFFPEAILDQRQSAARHSAGRRETCIGSLPADAQPLWLTELYWLLLTCPAAQAGTPSADAGSIWSARSGWAAAALVGRGRCVHKQIRQSETDVCCYATYAANAICRCNGGSRRIRRNRPTSPGPAHPPRSCVRGGATLRLRPPLIMLILSTHAARRLTCAVVVVVREPEENLAGAAEMLREFRQQLQQRREAGEGGEHSSDSDDALVEEPPRTKQKLGHAAAAATASNGKRKQQGKH